MKRFRNSPATPIGLDLGTRTVKAVQRVGPQVLSLALPRHAEAGSGWTEAEADRLRQVLLRRGFVGQEVVIAAPKRHTLTSVLELPPRKSGAPLEQLARAELAAAHRREAAGMETVSWELPRTSRASDGVAVLAAGCPNAEADAVIAPIEKAGLRVVGMDLEAWALARICSPAASSGSQLVAIADLGWSTGTLVLLYQGTVVYERQLTTSGLGGLAESLQREHGFPADAIDYLLFEVGFEAEQRGQADDWRLLMKGRSLVESHFETVAKELALSVRYAQHQYQHAAVDRVVLTGGGAGVPGLVGFMTPVLEARPEIASPAAAIGVEDPSLSAPLYAVAAGLSLWSHAEVVHCAA